MSIEKIRCALSLKFKKEAFSLEQASFFIQKMGYIWDTSFVVDEILSPLVAGNILAENKEEEFLSYQFIEIDNEEITTLQDKLLAMFIGRKEIGTVFYEEKLASDFPVDTILLGGIFTAFPSSPWWATAWGQTCISGAIRINSSSMPTIPVPGSMPAALSGHPWRASPLPSREYPA